MSPLTEVPVVDLTAARTGGRAERARVAAAIDAACRDIGFFAISGHGVPDRTVDDLRRVAHEFFALPMAEKLAIRHPVPGTNRGYHPVGGEALAQANDDTTAPPDLKEFFHVGPVDAVRERLARSVAIRLSTPPHGRATFEKLWDVFAQHKGDRRVAFDIEVQDSDRRLRVKVDVNAQIRVRPSERLVSDVEKICGTGSVTLR